MLERLLARTSRTFALAIPLLPEPLRREVAVAYLLFRIADTFEDAGNWSRERRLAALREFAELLRRPAGADLPSAWHASPPCDDEGCLELLRETSHVLAELSRATPARRELVVAHLLKTVEGMSYFVAQADVNGALTLNSESELRRYCYAVAGIVGELLTALFLDECPGLAPSKPVLERLAASFGEGLQLVNILKDADADGRAGRVYLPEALGAPEVVAIARRDLDAAEEYVDALRRSGAPAGIVAFCAFPAELARLTLAEIERVGPGAKVSRGDVAALLETLGAGPASG